MITREIPFTSLSESAFRSRSRSSCPPIDQVPAADHVALPQSATPDARPFDASLFGALKWRNIGPNRGGRSHRRRPAAPAGRSSTTSAPPAAGCGRPPTAARPGSRSPTARFTAPRSARSPSRSPTPTSSTSAWARPSCAATSCRATACTSRPTPARPGSTSASPTRRRSRRIRVHPTNPDLVYVAALGHPYGAERRARRLPIEGRRQDLGEGPVPRRPSRARSTWSSIRTTRRCSTPRSGRRTARRGSCRAAARAAGSSSRPTAATLDRDHAQPGLPEGHLGKIGIRSPAPTRNRVYAMVEAEDGGVFRSDDAGATWTQGERRPRAAPARVLLHARLRRPEATRHGLRAERRLPQVHRRRQDLQDRCSAPHGDNHDLWIAANDSQAHDRSNDGGGNVSVNGGETWTDAGLSDRAVLPRRRRRSDLPYHVCGAQQDNTTVCVSERRRPGRPAIRRRRRSVFYAVGGGESGYIAPHPTQSRHLLRRQPGRAAHALRSRARVRTRDIQVYPRFFSGEPARDLTERWQWTFPIVFSPLDPNVLYARRSTCGRRPTTGRRWERSAPT